MIIIIIIIKENIKKRANVIIAKSSKFNITFNFNPFTHIDY